MNNEATRQRTTVFDTELADEISFGTPLEPAVAQAVFDFFRSSSLFRWSDANNDCEDRANAICILLDSWGFPNGKAWVFSGDFRQKTAGQLTNFWNYHVAAAVPVQENGATRWRVIDPATSPQLLDAAQWAENVTQGGASYHFIKEGHWYIFAGGKPQNDNWHPRDRRNRNWTMQGLSGINGVSATGRAQLAFCKSRVCNTAAAFRRLEKQNPFADV